MISCDICCYKKTCLYAENMREYIRKINHYVLEKPENVSVSLGPITCKYFTYEGWEKEL